MCRAEEIGSGATLFPDGAIDEIKEWTQRSEEILASSRALATARIATDSDALLETVPSGIPGPLRRVFGAFGVRYLKRKYHLNQASSSEYNDRIHKHLDILRAAVDQRSSILDAFSYADITMACALQLISPVADRYIRLGHHTRRGMTHPEFRVRYSELLAWRDAVYQDFRMSD